MPTQKDLQVHRFNSYLVGEASPIIVDFWVVPQAVKNSFVGFHINITCFINLLRCKGLSCLYKFIQQLIRCFKLLK